MKDLLIAILICGFIVPAPMMSAQAGQEGKGGFTDRQGTDLINLTAQALITEIAGIKFKMFDDFPQRKAQVLIALNSIVIKSTEPKSRDGKELMMDFDKLKNQIFIYKPFFDGFKVSPINKENMQTVAVMLLHETAHLWDANDDEARSFANSLMQAIALNKKANLQNKVYQMPLESGTGNSDDKFASQRAYNLSIIEREESAIAKEIEKLNELDELMKNAEIKIIDKNITIWISAPSSIVGGALSALFAVAVLGDPKGLVEPKLFTKPVLITSTIAGIAFIVGTAYWIKTGYSISITQAEYKNYNKKRENILEALRIRQAGLAALKARIGVESKDIEFNLKHENKIFNHSFFSREYRLSPYTSGG